jgi:hypothetical protein
VCGQDGAVKPTARNWWPEDEDDYEAASTELKQRFGAWAGEHDVELREDAGEGLLHYKWGYIDGHLTRWKRGDLSELYLELYPAKVMVDPDELDEVLEEARAFVTFLADTGLLDPDSDPADVLLEHLGRIEGPFRAHMSDPSRFSFGKRMWTQARSEGVDLGDERAVDSFITRFNARPRAEREAVLGRSLVARQPAGGRVTPRGTQPRASAKRRKRRR